MVALVTWAWQGAVIAVLVSVALGMAPRRVSAATRHAIWWAALAAVLALPLASLAFGDATGEVVGRIAAASAAPLPVPWLEVPAPPSWVGALVLGGWLGLVIVGGRRIVCGLLHVRALKARALSVSASLEARLPLWRAARTFGRPVRLCTSDDVAIPCALGLGPAMVVVPSAWLDVVSDADLDAVVLHEHAHLVRRDDWGRLLHAVIETLAGVHPAIAWIGRRIELEREAAADDRVVAQIGSAREYARCLARLAALAPVGRCSSPSTLAVAPGAFRRVSGLRVRVARLLDAGRARRGSPGPLRRVLAFATMCLAVAGVGRFDHVIAVTDARATMRAAVEPDSRLGAPAVLERVFNTAGQPVAVPLSRIGRRSEPAGSPRSAVVTLRAERHVVGAAQHWLAPATAASGTAAPATLLRSREASGDVEPTAPIAASTHTSRQMTVVASAPASGPGTSVIAAAGDPAAWQVVADAGVAVGAGTRQAGLGLGRFFARGGRAMALSGN